MCPLTKRNRKQHWPGRQQGAVIVLVAFVLTTILLMGALALDGSHMLLNKTRLQNAVDAAALSGAKTLQGSFGSTDAHLLARAAVLDTLARNASAEGNSELGSAIGITAADVASHVEIAFSKSVYFDVPGLEGAKYVRVSVPNYPLTGFLWGVAQVFGGAGDKAVAAIATAGPSPSAKPCNIDPIMVCGNDSDHAPEEGVFWGYRFGDLVTLTCGKPGSPTAGNCQLLRINGSKGADDIRKAFCTGINQCDEGEVFTEPGISWGPVAQGLNTRLGIYNGPVDESCKADWYTEYSTPLIVMDGETPMQGSNAVVSDGGDLSAGTENELKDVNDWLDASKDCAASPGSCTGKAERRILNVMVADCSDPSLVAGTTPVTALGYGCFYLVQKVEQGGPSGGQNKEVFGQFVRECEGDGVAGPTPADDAGPTIIQLYKTYIDGAPTPDS